MDELFNNYSLTLQTITNNMKLPKEFKEAISLRKFIENSIFTYPMKTSVKGNLNMFSDVNKIVNRSQSIVLWILIQKTDFNGFIFYYFTLKRREPLSQ